MAATPATRTIGGERLSQGRRGITPALWSRIQEQAQADARQMAREAQPTVLMARDTYVFRTRPELGARSFVVYVDNNEEFHDDDRLQARHDRAYARRVPEALQAVVSKVIDTYGRTEIAFHRIGKTTETYFGTANEAVAEWLRAKIAEGRGSFALMYEDRGQVGLRVGDEVFPNTPISRERAIARSIETGLPVETYEELQMNPDNPSQPLQAGLVSRTTEMVGVPE